MKLVLLLVLFMAGCQSSQLYFADVPFNLWQLLDSGSITSWVMTLGSGKPLFKRNYCADMQPQNGVLHFIQIGSEAVASFNYTLGPSNITYTFDVFSGPSLTKSGVLGYGTSYQGMKKK